MGNIRVLFGELDSDGKIEGDDPNTPADESELMQINSYYSFGMLHEGNWNGANNTTALEYGFGGKELNEDLGLNWTDFGGRWYMADLGRWNAVDPLAEQGYSRTPYHYVRNNPLAFIDPTGFGEMPVARADVIDTGNDPPRKEVNISISGFVARDGDREITIQQVTQIVETTFFEDGSKTIADIGFNVKATITTLDGEKNIVFGEVEKSELNYCCIEGDKQETDNFYFNLNQVSPLTSDNYKELGIEGRPVIEGIMKELNAEGWNNILIAPQDTKDLVQRLEATTEQLGGMGITSPVASVLGGISSAFKNAVIESSKTGMSASFQNEFNYTINGN